MLTVSVSIESMDKLNALVAFASENGLTIQINAPSVPTQSSKKTVKNYDNVPTARDVVVELHVEADGVHFTTDYLAYATRRCLKKSVMTMEWDSSYELAETYKRDTKDHKVGDHKMGAWVVSNKAFLPKDHKVIIKASDIESERKAIADKKAKKANK